MGKKSKALAKREAKLAKERKRNLEKAQHEYRETPEEALAAIAMGQLAVKILHEQGFLDYAAYLYQVWDATLNRRAVAEKTGEIPPVEFIQPVSYKELEKTADIPKLADAIQTAYNILPPEEREKVDTGWKEEEAQHE